jgi:pimeloyl-ACP methyl ester carboxylesterase
VVIGHSYGGKVALEYANHCLVPPHKVICLDNYVGLVPEAHHAAKQHTSFDNMNVPDMLSLLQSVALPLKSPKHLYPILIEAGCSEILTRWMMTNLKVSPDYPADQPNLVWKFTLEHLPEVCAIQELNVSKTKHNCLEVFFSFLLPHFRCMSTTKLIMVGQFYNSLLRDAPSILFAEKRVQDGRFIVLFQFPKHIIGIGILWCTNSFTFYRTPDHIQELYSNSHPEKVKHHVLPNAGHWMVSSGFAI